MAFNIVESDSKCVLENNGAERGQCVAKEEATEKDSKQSEKAGRVGSSAGKGDRGSNN